MNKFELDSTTDHAGAVQIRVPNVPANHRVHIVVEWEDPPTDVLVGWPPGWFEQTAGSIDDPTLERAPQGDYEVRDKGAVGSRNVP